MTAAPLRTVVPAAPEAVAGDAVALWASYQVTNLDAGDAPEYGSPAWCALRTSDPRRAVAVITAAEQWRRDATREAWLDHLLDTDADAWFRIVTEDANAYAARIAPALARRPTRDELAARRTARAQSREVAAAPGWPPVAIPGHPGWWRHYGPRGEQLDMPHNRHQERQHRDHRLHGHTTGRARAA